MGSALTGAAGAVTALANGDIVAGGLFAIGFSNAMRWNGTAWSSMTVGNGALVRALETLPNGDLVAGGYFQLAGSAIASWNGTTWSSMGTAVVGLVQTLETLQNGDLVAGGSFSIGTGPQTIRNIARWNGTVWSPIGTGLQGGGLGGPLGGNVYALLELPNGDLIAGGDFTLSGSVQVNQVARWDGASWMPLGSGFPNLLRIRALATLPNGDIVAGGSYPDPVTFAPIGFLSRWNGSTWQPLAAGIGGGSTGIGVYCLETMPDGDLVSGGSYNASAGVVRAVAERLTTTCPATVATSGAGCPGSGGANDFQAQNLPWIGTTFRGRGTSIPALAFAATVTGFAAVSIPLAGILPPSLPNCSLLVAPDIVDVTLAAGGTVDSALAIPNSLQLVGQSFFQQIVLLEVDTSFAFLQNTSTNALQLGIGSFQ